MRTEFSMTPTAIRARERRLDAFVKREERKINAEVKAHMDNGLSFDEAWIAAGGLIIPLKVNVP